MRTDIRSRIVPVTLTPLFALVVLASGCASHNFVRNEDEIHDSAMHQELDEIGGEVERVESQVAQLETIVEGQGERTEALSRTAQEALDRATAAGNLAQGKFLYETILSDDEVQFGFEQYSLSDEARQALDAFAAQLKERNQDLFVEVQGHTDSSGDESHNLILGERRAESVRRYLSLEHGIPLHRVAVVSYGEAAPLEENSTREGRSRNRRVSLVVLQ